MASFSLPLLLLSLIFLLSSFSNAENPKAFSFRIRKDKPTGQYYTRIQIGSNSTTFNVVVHIGAPFLWFNSPAYFNAASSYRPIRCGSPQCQLVADPGCVTTTCDNSSSVPGCTHNTCADFAPNPFSGVVGYNGLGHDMLRVQSTLGDFYTVKNFPFQYSDPSLLDGLAGPTAGVIGLGRTRISLLAQLASAFKTRHKFALCLGNPGKLIVGQTAYKKPFLEISKSLFTTRLIRNPVSSYPDDQRGNFSLEYFIDVTSIRVGERSLVFNKTLLSIDKTSGEGGTVLRTVKAYTGLHRSIYTVLIDEFVKAAASKKITRVKSVSPFGACFDSKTIRSSKTGPDVPTIDLVLEGKSSVYWRMYGSNSVVAVSKDVTCLAFVEDQRSLVGTLSSITVGGYQMENHMLEFDVGSAIFKFSNSLLVRDTSCSHFA